MTSYKIVFSLILSGAVGMLFCTPGYCAQRVYVLTQNSKYVGPQTAYISPDSLRLESARTGSSILLRPPGKAIQIINDSKQIYYETNVNKWRGKSLMNANSLKQRYANHYRFRFMERGVICGLNADKYVLDSSSDASEGEISSHKEQLSYWLARDIHISSTACEILSHSIGSVPLDREVLRVESLKKKKKSKKAKTSIIFDTDKCEVKMMDDSIFSVPKNYKRVNNEIEVLIDLDANELEGINSIIYKSKSSGELPGKSDVDELKSIFKGRAGR